MTGNLLYTVTKKEELPHRELILEIEIPASGLSPWRQAAIKTFKERLEMPGFRRGRVPEEVITSRLGETVILEEALTLALSDNYTLILEKEGIAGLGRPAVTILKIGAGGGVLLRIRTALRPQVSLPDYRKIARKMNTGTSGAASSETEAPPGVSHRLRLVSAVLSESKIEMPKGLIESELRRIEARFKHDLETAGIKLDDYLSRVGKKMEEIRQEWLPGAERNAKVQVLFEAIAEKEKFMPDEKKVEEETKKILSEAKEADPTAARIYVEVAFMNEAVMKLLEEEK
ncbi:MAG: hypothetical protein HYT43_01275 [Candidatus Taylorbacteria bacterium]|nr:hypothetical protein [Candidatus Taylorbacteria bacterium]